MPLSRFALDLLELIEDGRYAEAAEKLETTDKSEEVDLISEDLLRRVGACFGHERKEDLERLTQVILRFGTPATRTLIIEDLFQNVPSIHLFRILLAALVVDFDELSEKKRQELKLTLPVLLEEKTLRIIEEHEELVTEAAGLCAHLFTFCNYAGSKYNFSDLVGTLVRAIKPTMPQMGAILMNLAENRPFHPVLQYAIACSPQENTPIPLVFSRSYMLNKLIEELAEYLQVYSGGSEQLMVDVTISVLKHLTIMIGPGGLDASFMSSFTALLGNLLKIVQDFDIGEKRNAVMKLFIRLLDSFDLTQRALILKRLMFLLSTQKIKLEGESLILAWMIDLYRRDLKSKEFKAELGSIWTLIFPLRYSEIVESTAFYVATYCLVQHQALMKWNPGLMLEVRENWLKPVRKQVTDFMELQKMREKSNAADTPKNLSAVLPIDYDSSNMNLVITSMEISENYVNEFLSKS